MKLEVGFFRVDDAWFGDELAYVDGRLAIDRQVLHSIVGEFKEFASVDFAIARPGESARIIHVLDAIEPRIKVDGAGVAFPGFLGLTDPVGRGRTNRLGMLVVQSSLYPQPVEGLLRAREAIIDMSGPGAAYAFGSDTVNLVINFHPAAGTDNAAYDAAMRLASLRISHYLATAVRGLHAPTYRTFELGGGDPSLPGVVYIYQLQSQGLFADTFLYGENARRLVPTLIHPNEIFDGALVSAVYILASMKNPTAVHCNNPVLLELFDRHGKDLRFLGVVLNEGHNKALDSKQRSAHYAAKLAMMLGAQGVVLTQESGGMSIVDQMLTAQACENLGIRSSVISYEMGGPGGADPPFIYSVQEADAIVSTGNREEPLGLPAMERVVGGTALVDSDQLPGGALTATVNWLYNSTSQAGERLRAFQY